MDCRKLFLRYQPPLLGESHHIEFIDDYTGSMIARDKLVSVILHGNIPNAERSASIMLDAHETSLFRILCKIATNRRILCNFHSFLSFSFQYYTKLFLFHNPPYRGSPIVSSTFIIPILILLTGTVIVAVSTIGKVVILDSIIAIIGILKISVIIVRVRTTHFLSLFLISLYSAGSVPFGKRFFVRFTREKHGVLFCNTVRMTKTYPFVGVKTAKVTKPYIARVYVYFSRFSCNFYRYGMSFLHARK